MSFLQIKSIAKFLQWMHYYWLSQNLHNFVQYFPSLIQPMKMLDEESCGKLLRNIRTYQIYKAQVARISFLNKQKTTKKTFNKY
jgi:hypothetical protein